MTNFIENPEDATKNVKRLFRTLFDNLRRMVPSEELYSTLYQVQKLLRIVD